MRTLLLLAFILSVSSTAFAQWADIPPPQIPRTPDGKPNLSAPAPRLPDGKPDLSGIWNPPTGYLRNLARDLKEEVPFQPWAKAIYDERAAGKFWREEPDANCLPQGVPKVLLAPAPWQIVQTPGVIFFIHEAFNLWWQAFADGLGAFPPTYLSCGSEDSLLGHTLELTKALASAGVAVTASVVEGLDHVFVKRAGSEPAAARELERVHAWLDERLRG